MSRPSLRVSLLTRLDEALERDASYRAERAGDEKTLSPACKEVLQHLRSRIVELNYQRNQVFEERVAAWIEFHQAHWVKSNSQYFTYCEEYWDLLEMGTSIIAPLMVEYERLQWGYWFHLLHELVHGHKLRAHSYQKPVLYDECVRWFIEGDHEDAPLYVPTESDRKYIGSMEGFWEDSPTGQQ